MININDNFIIDTSIEKFSSEISPSLTSLILTSNTNMIPFPMYNDKYVTNYRDQVYFLPSVHTNQSLMLYIKVIVIYNVFRRSLVGSTTEKYSNNIPFFRGIGYTNFNLYITTCVNKEELMKENMNSMFSSSAETGIHSNLDKHIFINEELLLNHFSKSQLRSLRNKILTLPRMENVFLISNQMMRKMFVVEFDMHSVSLNEALKLSSYYGNNNTRIYNACGIEQEQKEEILPRARVVDPETPTVIGAA